MVHVQWVRYRVARSCQSSHGQPDVTRIVLLAHVPIASYAILARRERNVLGGVCLCLSRDLIAAATAAGAT